MHRETWRKMADPTGTYGYVAQSPPTDGHPAVLFLPIAPVQAPVGLSHQDARRFARPIGLLPQGLGWN
jgi:hypothetical protein